MKRDVDSQQNPVFPFILFLMILLLFSNFLMTTWYDHRLVSPFSLPRCFCMNGRKRKQRHEKRVRFSLKRGRERKQKTTLATTRSTWIVVQFSPSLLVPSHLLCITIEPVFCSHFKPWLRNKLSHPRWQTSLFDISSVRWPPLLLVSFLAPSTLFFLSFLSLPLEHQMQWH